MLEDNEIKVAIIGLGYVGLPLAVECAKKYPTVGFDIASDRVQELMSGIDKTLEVENSALAAVLAENSRSLNSDGRGLFCSDDPDVLKEANFYIITVPTPTDKNKRPVLVPLQKASECVGKHLSKGDYVVYESTVYPGVTEEECVPILERESGLACNDGFFVGYSPERINPGDKERTLTKIKKVTSGSTPMAAREIDKFYNSIITAGTFSASSIKVAEAAKVIENSQRDINIAFVNELAKIFNRLGIDTHSVLEAAETKWNFLPFKPGLVGGHCIGVDPYYLAQKAQEVGYHPEIILSGRRLNDDMGAYVGSEIIKLMLKNQLHVAGSSLLMLGITFKENCPDIRNTKAIDVYNELISYNASVDVFDPWASGEEVSSEYGIQLIPAIKQKYDAVVLTVSHAEFLDLNLKELVNSRGVVYDVKGALKRTDVDGRL